MAKEKKKGLTENERWLQTSQEHVKMLVEIATHIDVLSKAGVWCEVYFDTMTTLNGAPPKVGAMAVKIDDAGNSTLMNIKPSSTSALMVLEDLRVLTGSSPTDQPEGA